MIATKCSHTKPHVVHMQITPAMAANWLENANVKNRKISDLHVKRLARDMKEGRWISSTHEGIAFDPNGVLLDGQHRLWAIIEADKAITMHVWFNISPRALMVIGGGKPRSMVDILRLGGQVGDVNQNEVSVLRAMLSGYRNPITMTPQETSVALSRHREAIHFAVRHLPSVKARGICNVYTRAVIARAYYGVDHEKLTKFGDMLATGIVVDTPAATAVVALRQYLLVTRGQSYAERRERYGKSQRALMAFLHDEPVRKLVSATREFFPLPEEIQN